jgi:hypothetical protein
MRKSSIDLRDPRVVITVAVLLVVVAAVNMQTFLPRLWQQNAGETAWDPDAFTPPIDTAELTRVAAGRATGVDAPAAGTAAMAGAGLGGGVRDPFLSSRPSTAAPAGRPEPSPATAKAAPRSAPAARGLVCTAVLCAGTRATAVIDGEMREVGDPVGEWRVVAISPAGVLLRGPHGEKRLAVGGNGDGAARYPLVTRSAAAAAADNTTLEPVSGSREP